MFSLSPVFIDYIVPIQLLDVTWINSSFVIYCRLFLRQLQQRHCGRVWWISLSRSIEHTV